MRKGTAAEAERDASQHAVGGIERVYFFRFIFIHQFKSFFFYFCISSRPKFLFISANAPGGAFCPAFVLKNAPGTLKTPGGRYFGIVSWNAPGGVYSVLYGIVLATEQTRVTTDQP